MQIPLHCALMRNLGIAFNEICNFEELAPDCHKDGQWDFLYVAAPLKVRRRYGLAGQRRRDQVNARRFCQAKMRAANTTSGIGHKRGAAASQEVTAE